MREAGVDTQTDSSAAMRAETSNAAAERERLEAELAQLKEELRREHEMYLRVLADFDNYRRRIECERANAAHAGKRELVLALLELIDDLECTLKQLQSNPQSILEGLRAMQQRLTGVLAAQGVTPFESLGQPFDPALHEAVDLVKSSEIAPGTVLDEMSQGYRWDNEILRPARVRVAQ
jgi:molecular chaperone GrpE